LYRVGVTLIFTRYVFFLGAPIRALMISFSFWPVFALVYEGQELQEQKKRLKKEMTPHEYCQTT
jgi:hypothetical protein